jgi:sortase A
MAMYRYVKASPPVLRPRRRVRGLSFILMSIGGGLLAWVIWPILSFSAVSDVLFSQTITPIDDEPKTTKNAGLLSPVALAAGTAEAAASVEAVDFTNANAWYPTAPQRTITAKVNTYSLSIPKLKIADAMVIISGDDLETSLVHYGGTGLPGEFGTAVVFGHSTLPQFYSPKNYKSIFSLLPTLEIGDHVDVTYDGVKYTYEIFDMQVRDPSDLSVLEQKFDDSYITLVTCVPPGTYWKRLNVKARLTSL